MRFLLMNQFFPPDPAPTGQLLEHVAQGLVEAGHEVTVVAGSARYADAPRADEPSGVAQGLVGAGHETTVVANSARYADAPGAGAPVRVAVRRVRCLSFGRGRLGRLASYASFFAGALRRVIFCRADAVVTMTTPPLLSVCGAIAKFVHGSAHFNWEMDLYPDVATALGVMQGGGAAERLAGAVADFARRRADGNIVLGPCMRDRIVARGVPPERVEIAENWTDRSLISPRPFPAAKPLTVLYSGNLGLAHEIDTIAEAINRIPAPERFRFVFAGGGPRRKELASRCARAEFAPYQDAGRLAEHLGGCHIGLVTQTPETCGTLVPSKVYAYLAAGRPFLFIGPSAATPARILQRFDCGWRVEPGDVPGALRLLNRLAGDPEMLRAAGRRAREAFLKSYDREAGVARVLAVLTASGQREPAAADAVCTEPTYV